MRFSVLIITLLGSGMALRAQSEAALRAYFEGKTVRAKIDLPGTHDGLDVNFRQVPPFDSRTYQRRLDQWGAGVPAGRDATVTLVRVKGKNIEFQLGGGGLKESLWVYVPDLPPPDDINNLESAIRDEKDPKRKQALQRDLSYARQRREDMEETQRKEKTRLEQAKLQEAREKALRSGSRINLWFPEGYLKGATPTPQEFMRMLADFIDFSPAPVTASEARLEFTPEAAQRSGWGQQQRRASATGLARGMNVDAVHRLLGNPERYRETMEGRIKLLTEAWEFESESLEVDFAEGVALRWRVSSK